MGRSEEKPDSERRFAASSAARSRWGKRQKALRLATIPFGLIVVLRLVTAKGNLLAITLVATVVAMVVVTGIYVCYRGSAERFPKGSLWAGTGTLSFDAVERAKIGGNIRFKSKLRLNFWTQSRRELGARLQVLPDGLRWDFRLVAWLAGVRGFVFVPWGDVDGVQIGDVPGVLNKGLGGGYTVQLKTGIELDGTFVGSRGLLLTALEQTPLRTSP
jgi:hypothetical protein